MAKGTIPQQTRIGRLLAQLQREARRRRISAHELARKADLHPNTLRDFEGFGCRRSKGAWSPSVRTIERLEPILLPRRA